MGKTLMTCIRNTLLAEAITSLLSKMNPAFEIVEEKNAELFCSILATYLPDVVVIEVKEMIPHTLSDWLVRIHLIKQKVPNCKIALIVDDESYPELAELVKKEKSKGTVDAFFYSSSGLKYLVDAIDSL